MRADVMNAWKRVVTALFIDTPSINTMTIIYHSMAVNSSMTILSYCSETSHDKFFSYISYGC